MKAGYVIAFILWSILMVFIGSKLYREQVEVLEPQELRDEIKESLETCLTKYK